MLLSAACGSCEPAEPFSVTLEGLLDEMMDRDALTRFPSPAYVQKQVSSYDRRSVAPDQPGWFANDDGAGYEILEKKSGRYEKVMCDLKGPGAVTRIWMTTKEKYGTIRIYLDGASKPQIVIPAYDMRRFPMEVPEGLSLTHTHYVEAMDGVGGNSFFLPIPYQKGCKITFEEPEITVKIPRYYHIGYREYPECTSVETFSLKAAEKLLGKMSAVSAELLNPDGNTPSGEKRSESGSLAPGDRVSLRLSGGAKAVRRLVIQVSGFEPADYSSVMETVRVKASFDGKDCIDAPLAFFALSGFGAPQVDGWWISSDGKGTVICRYPMPFRKDAVVSVCNDWNSSVDASIEIIEDAYDWTEGASLYLHCAHHGQNGIPLSPDYDRNDNLDWNFATLNGRGIYVGDILAVNNHAIDWYGEGDEKIWVDGEDFPSHFGTGTEDYFNCSWAPVVPFLTPWGGAPRADEASSHGFNAFCRTRILDAIPFRSSFVFDIEMLSWHEGTADYATGYFWYGD